MTLDKKGTFVRKAAGPVALAILFSISLVHGAYAQEGTTVPSSPSSFLTDLTLGSSGPDVQRLQEYLNAHDFPLASAGAGSAGQETTYFGPMTKAALVLFQQHFSQEILVPVGLSYATGNFYASTRAFVNRSLPSGSQSASSTVSQSSPVPGVQTSVRRGGSRSSSPASYVVTPSSASHVTVSPSDPQTVSLGSTRSFTVTADTGYTLSGSVGGTCPSGSWNGSLYTTGSITGSCSVSFLATADMYEVTLNGAVAPSGTLAVEHGARQSFTVESGSGYGLGSVSGTCPAGSWVHATYLTGAITAPCSVSFSAGALGSVGSSIMAEDILYLRQNGSDLEFSTDGTDWSVSSMPLITNTGPGTLTVELLGDFTLSQASGYLIVGSDDITFQGETGVENPTIVTIANVSNYPGFIRNGSNGNAGYSNIVISDLFVNAVSSTLSSAGGWLGQAYFGNGATGNEIMRCGSNGTVSNGGGGVIGAYAENVVISDCFTTGAIATNGGGIAGLSSTGVTVDRSYSTGTIGSNGGGIFGASANNPVASNVFSTGTIGSNGGGIFGDLTSGQAVTHAYTSGSNADGSTGGIAAGFASDGATNYSEANAGGSGWSDAHASTALTGLDTIWKSISAHTPYRLAGFTASPYADPSQTIAAGGSSAPVFGYYPACALMSINGGSPGSYGDISFDEDTGVISTADDTVAGSYAILVRCDSLHGTYTFSTLDLTVN